MKKMVIQIWYNYFYSIIVAMPDTTQGGLETVRDFCSFSTLQFEVVLITFKIMWRVYCSSDSV